MQTGPIFSEEFLKIEILVQQNYVNTLSQVMGEVGNCKRMIHLNPHFDLTNEAIGLAMTRYSGEKDKALIEDELKYLDYLSENGFPVVKLFSNHVFEIQNRLGATHYGMLMRYIENATLIEAKTPSSLFLCIFSALLGIKVYTQQEAWLIQNQARILKEIAAKLQQPETFLLLKARAKTLYNHFDALIKKLSENNLFICDLQILLTQEGELTIIDPLDVVKFDSESSSAKSVLHPERAPEEGFTTSLAQGKKWLESAHFLCKEISRADNPLALEKFISLHPEKCFFSVSDPKGKSTIAKLIRKENLSTQQSTNPSSSVPTSEKPSIF